MQVCPSCQHELSEKGFHCSSCGVQTRCKVCRDILDLNARYCENCGALRGETSLSPSYNQDIGAVESRMNIIQFEEDTRSRRFHATVTDRAIESVSKPLSYFLTQSMSVQSRRVRQVHTMPGTVIDPAQPILPGLVMGDEEDDQEDSRTAPLEVRKALPAATEAGQLQEIFRINSDNKWTLMNPRLKQNSRRDFVVRLSLLFLYAHAVKGRELIPRGELRDLLTNAKVQDGNANKVLASTDLLTREGDLIGLSVLGRERAQEILKQVYDPNVETKWNLGSRGSTRSRKAVQVASEATEHTEDKTTRNRRPKGMSHHAQIKKLIDEDYFKDPRSGVMVKDELEKLGHKFEQRRINESLVIYTQKELLVRERNEADTWMYQSK